MIRAILLGSDDKILTFLSFWTYRYRWFPFSTKNHVP
jgi:hypothetical protein